MFLAFILLLATIGAAKLTVDSLSISKNLKEQPFNAMSGGQYSHLSIVEQNAVRDRYALRLRIPAYGMIFATVALGIATVVLFLKAI